MPQEAPAPAWGEQVLIVQDRLVRVWKAEGVLGHTAVTTLAELRGSMEPTWEIRLGRVFSLDSPGEQLCLGI